MDTRDGRIYEAFMTDEELSAKRDDDEERKAFIDKLLNQIPVIEKEDLEFIIPMAHHPTPTQRATGKVGRNDTCPCGSGKKFKKCCLFRKKEP